MQRRRPFYRRLSAQRLTPECATRAWSPCMSTVAAPVSGACCVSSASGTSGSPCSGWPWRCSATPKPYGPCWKTATRLQVMAGAGSITSLWTRSSSANTSDWRWIRSPSWRAARLWAGTPAGTARIPAAWSSNMAGSCMTRIPTRTICLTGKQSAANRTWSCRIRWMPTTCDLPPPRVSTPGSSFLPTSGMRLTCCTGKGRLRLR